MKNFLRASSKPFALVVFAAFATLVVSMAGIERLYAQDNLAEMVGTKDIKVPNSSFESWATQDGVSIPNKWVVDQVANTGQSIARSSKAQDGASSVQFSPLNGADVALRSDAMYVNFDPSLKSQVRIKVKVKSATNNGGKGKVSVLGLLGFEMCGDKFVIEPETGGWTTQQVVCQFAGESSTKMYIRIADTGKTPLLFDSVSMVQFGKK